MNTYTSGKQTHGRWTFLLAALLLLVALAACGGDDATESEPTVAVEAQPTAVEPTVASTDVPPAEEPTDVPAADPTAEPPTETPAEPDTTAPTGELNLTGDCGNAFYPVIDGRTYHYVSNMAGVGESGHSQSYSDVSDSSFTVSTLVDGETVVSATWSCSAGGLLSPEFSQIPGAVEGMTVEFVEATGLSIPPEDKFQPGESWQAHYVANVEMPDMGAGEMLMVQTIDLSNETIAIEPVSVPAGDYPEAVRVDSVATIGLSFMVDGSLQPTSSLEMSYTSWYVEGVGLVLSEFDEIMGMGGGRTELVSIDE